MQETRFIAKVGTYFAACDLVRALAAAGIQANITAGGVAIVATAETAKKMRALCAVAGVRCLPGAGTMAEIPLCESSKGRKIVAASIDAAIVLVASVPDA